MTATAFAFVEDARVHLAGMTAAIAQGRPSAAGAGELPRNEH